jgi:peptidyl-dipeptidase Dcp
MDMNNDNAAKRVNPFFSKYNTPHGTIPFDAITLADYEEAFLKGMAEEDREIEAIVNNPETPTFENTIVAMTSQEGILERVSSAFYTLLHSETTDEMDALAEKMSPLLSEHSNNISMNERLFARVKAVYDAKPVLGTEEQRLLENTYKGFVRSGALLDEEKKAQLKELSKEAGLLSLKFSQNVLKETNNFTLHLTTDEEVSGIPERVLETAAMEAKEKGLEGWLFTLHAPSYSPFLTYADNRELRRKMFMAYNTMCTHEDEYNNYETVRQIVNKSREMVQLLGYRTYADFVLEKRMAKDSQHVYQLLDQLLEAYRPTAEQEVREVEELARETEGGDFRLERWDYAYYAHKLQVRKYNLDAEMLRPYFQLNKVIEGVFGLATRLYGITFRENPEIPVFHKDVKAYEVFDKDGSYLAVLYADFFPRKSKKSGAWMSEYKDQWIEEDGTNSRPHVSVNMNFAKPTESKPSLLSLGEIETFLHEFGHALHGIFANSRFAALSGTNVYRDFVELPSQIMENFAGEKEFLHTFARHYETGELLPDELIERIHKSRNFNVGYACLRQLSFGMLDMAYYDREEDLREDIPAFEQRAWAPTQLLPEVEGTCMSVQFSHIMAGGYSAGYYSYKWAEVLDADAFSLFRKKGIFSSEVAESFRSNILSKGGTEHPMELYKRFRGQEPTIDALLIRNGIKQER